MNEHGTTKHTRSTSNTVYFDLSRYNGKPAPHFDSALSWLSFGFHCSWLDNLREGRSTSVTEITETGLTKTGLTEAKMAAAINVFKQLMNQTYHLLYKPDFLQQYQKLRETYYTTKTFSPFVFHGQELCYVDCSGKRYRTGIMARLPKEDFVEGRPVMGIDQRKKMLKRVAIDR